MGKKSAKLIFVILTGHAIARPKLEIIGEFECAAPGYIQGKVALAPCPTCKFSDISIVFMVYPNASASFMPVS
jgi:hypothetical protein